MLHTYQKTATVKAEQFKATNKQLNDYHICWDYKRTHHGKGVKNYYLPTLEGDMFLYKGDYIVTGIDGEHWSVKKEIFERTYARID